MIAGDINIDLAKCGVNKQTAEYIDTLLVHNFVPIVIMPTRITSKSATLIDHIYYYEGKNNKRNIHAKSGNLLNDLTDHLPKYTILISKKIVAEKERPLIWLFTEASKNRFINDLKLIDWNIVYNETDTNAVFNTFSNSSYLEKKLS